MRAEDFSEHAPGRLILVPAFGPRALAFDPAPLPRHLDLPLRVHKKEGRACGLLGRLHGAGEILNPWLDLFLRKEAIASNAIEGTFTTARDLYVLEAAGELPDATAKEASDTREVLNYVAALEYGVDLLKEMPMCLRVITQIHGRLLEGDVRGASKRPGEFRQNQNLIGTKRSVEDARFVPPPVPQMHAALADLEKFIHEESDLPDLVRLALIHYQFETIHPFEDGNGRVGRLILPLILGAWGHLPPGTPRLYLSAFFQENDKEYRDLLLKVSQQGAWEEWIEFFIDAVIEEAASTWTLAEALGRLRTRYCGLVSSRSGRLRSVVERLFVQPVMQAKDIAAAANVSDQQARNYARELIALGVFAPGAKTRGRFYMATEILHTFFGEGRPFDIRASALEPPAEPPESAEPQPPLPLDVSAPPKPPSGNNSE